MQLALWIYLALQHASSEPAEANLVEKVRIFAPSLDLDRVRTHVMAATNAAHAHGLAPDLLLAQAYVESRFDPTATSRIVGGKRITGSWPSFLPAGIGPRFCGPLQTTADKSWLKCLAMRVPAIGYWVGAVELGVWLHVTHGDLHDALNGYGCGYLGITNGCNNYAERVFAWTRRIAGRSS